MDNSDTLKNRLFDEAHAMVAYIAARGLDKDAPNPELIKLLDRPKAERGEIPLGDVMALHQTLARVVSPAYPETIYKLHHFRETAWFLSLFAPLRSIFYLIAFTVALALLLAFGLSEHSQVDLPEAYYKAQANLLEPSPTPLADRATTPYFEPVIAFLQGQCRFSVEELTAAVDAIDPDDSTVVFENAVREHLEKCQDLRRPLLLRMFLFFGVLGMLGAAYSSIYDSFSFIKEGRYDLRLASTYYVRILLGGFSGILLAEPLSEFLDQGAVSSVLLAFIGGFSAQLVYDLLTKLVDSIANMFRADRRSERRSIQAQAEINARSVIMEDDAAKRHNLAQTLSQVQAEPDPEKRSQMMQDALLQLMSGKGAQTGSDASPGGAAPLAEEMQVAESFATLSLKIAPNLPDAPPDAATDTTAALERLKSAMATLTTSDTGASITEGRAALQDAQQADLVTSRVRSGISDLGDALSEASLPPIAKGALLAASIFDDGQTARWRYFAYRAVASDERLLNGVDPALLGNGLPRADGSLIPPEDMIKVLSADGRDALFETEAAGFADRNAFDTALSGWIDGVVRQDYARDLDTVLVPKVGTTLSGAALVEALSQVSESETARGGLQTLELVGSGVPDCPAHETVLRHLMALADDLLSKETAP